MIALLGLLPGVATALEPGRADQATSITRAVAVAGKLWIVTDTGTLSSVQLGTFTSIRERTDRPVVDECSRSGSLVVALENRAAAVWTLARRAGEKWTVLGNVPRHGDDFVALVCDARGVAILTSRRLVGVATDDRESITLSRALPAEEVASVFAMPGYVFVGVNAGEWGGGLDRIDRRSGKVEVIQSGGVCEGPLNADCDPVTAITPDPWNARCIVIAIGLVHLSSHGRIDEVCGSNVRALFYRKARHQMAPDCKQPSGEPCETEPFFGAVRRADDVIAVATGGLFVISRNGSAKEIPLPPFHRAGDVYLTYDVPGFVLVLTDVNQRRSVSGSVPLLVPR